MTRRKFLGVLGGAAAAWPVAAWGQQPALPVVGFLNFGSLETRGEHVAAFRQGLNEAGFIEGQNVTIEYRWANGQADRLPSLVADLLSRQVGVIAATGGTASVRAAKVATTTIPILFTIGGDPVKLGLVASLNRPGGNVTGSTQLSHLLVAKQLEMLHELLPTANEIAFLINPNNPNANSDAREAQLAAGALRKRLHVIEARTDADLATAFATLSSQVVSALLVEIDPHFIDRRNQIVALSARHAVPVVYPTREFVQAGGLMSYGASLVASYREIGIYCGKILKGAKPEDLPVLQPSKFEMVINLQTAKALNFSIRDKLMALADEVIE